MGFSAEGRIKWLLQASLARLRTRPGCSDIARMSAAVYVPETDLVKALAQAGCEIEFFDEYDFNLSDLPGLALVAASGRPRVYDGAAALPVSAPMHSRVLVHAGMRAGMALPICDSRGLNGFLFLNAREPGYFSPRVQSALSPFLNELSGHLAREFNRATEALTLNSSRV